MNDVIRILMERDGMTRQEAEEYYETVREDMHEAIEEGDYDLVEEMMYGDLGLEMDYIFDML